MSEEQGDFTEWESRALTAATNCLKAHSNKKDLLGRVHSLLRTFYVMFNEMVKKLPPNTTELEFHEDRICFQLGGVPLTVIYLKDEKPMYVEINKKPVLSERMYICDRNFGSGGYESEGPEQREVGSIFIAEECFLVRWDGKVDVWSSEHELIDSILNNYYSIQAKHVDKDGNEIQISSDAWLYGQNKAHSFDEDTGEVHLPIHGANLGMYNIPRQR